MIQIRATALLVQGPAIDTEWHCSAWGDTPRRALSKLVDSPEFRDDRMLELVGGGNVKMEIHVTGSEVEDK